MESRAASQLQEACSPAAPPPQQLQADDPSRMWLPELVQRFAVSLSPNEVAGTLRLVNKATATQFRGTQHSTMRLSQPVPHHAFVWRWAGPGAMRRLSVCDRRALARLTARSGSTANLEVLLARDDLGLDAPPMLDSLFESAAEAGQLDMCAWLQQQGWPLGTCLLDAAARGGQQAVYEWLLANGCPNGNEVEAAAQAAKRGHVRMMDWLLLGASAPEEMPLCKEDLLQAVAAGCDLPTLQRLHHTYLDSRGGELPDWSQQEVVAAAAGSPTADWQAKVLWLEARGCPRAEEACTRAAAEPDALARLQWLRQRGYPFGQLVAHRAAGAGSVEALQYVLDQGGAGYDGVGLMESAAHGGHVAIMEVLHARGIPADEHATVLAAAGGHLPAVAWLVEKLGAGTALTAGLFVYATGNMALMMWLREMGCPWGEQVFALAAKDGSEEQLEWLAEQGCPMGDDGHPYLLATFYRNLAILPCLRRLGCPWSPDGSTFTSLIKQGGIVKDVMRALSWMLDQGCPVDWGQAEAAAKDRREEGLLEWLRTHKQQRT